MAELVMRYRRGPEERGIAVHRRLVLDLAARGPAYVVAELAAEEGRPQIAAVLFGEGRYIERARTSERRLCRTATAAELDRGGWPAAWAA
jgi:hypothetical protein